eukprot:gb/GECG01005854.1/.p1 GENE.gb/GECG01005854.1/~~gb/GECG01005854.1/.p1  ORF type:complete len:318 (+),score=31.92 gb/GECG01005854.1/:1-954(+)
MLVSGGSSWTSSGSKPSRGTRLKLEFSDQLQFNSAEDFVHKVVTFRDTIIPDIVLGNSGGSADRSNQYMSSPISDALPIMLQCCALSLKTGGRVVLVADAYREEHYVTILRKLGVENSILRDQRNFRILPLLYHPGENSDSSIPGLPYSDVKKTLQQIMDFFKEGNREGEGSPTLVAISDVNMMESLQEDGQTSKLLYRFIHNLKAQTRQVHEAHPKNVGVLLRCQLDELGNTSDAAYTQSSFPVNFCGDMADYLLDVKPLASGYASDIDGNVTVCKRVTNTFTRPGSLPSLSTPTAAVCYSYKVTEQGIKLLQRKG